ncbi:hypothetical protein LMG8520_0543 [Lactococcus lactis subsp. lactis]|jgi:hypothetical protein|uniref:Uncharacterized protein n=2 Tax=Lactococcus lactis TaxID=1358 RepID=A0A2A5SJW4_LACLH|nr:hypothetical protein LMG8520_0543 [Lactococcus lactis subsp. lactis]PCS13683.1 hypothetical protein RU90_GL002067 [Lactococcus lactis subsp. hordniae]
MLFGVFFKYFFVSLIIILGIVTAYFIIRVQENERKFSEVDKAKQTH